MSIEEMMDVNFRGNIYIVQNGKVLYERESGFGAVALAALQLFSTSVVGCAL